MATAAKCLLGIWIAGVVVLAYQWLPPADLFVVPEAARIVALHLPLAIASVVAAFTAAFFGGRYLARRALTDDARSKNAAALAVLFCILTTATGSVFAKVQWLSFWNWDPRQICISLLILIYAAYFVLRAGVEDEEKRAAVTAVYVLFAAVMTPVLGYAVPKYMPSLHPTDTKFQADYRTVILMASAGFIGLYVWMQNLADRADFARMALDREEEDADAPGLAREITGASVDNEKETVWTR